jgi:hypothetical protein
MSIDDTVNGIRYARFASVTISSGSDGCSAAFTVKHESGIFGNFESVISEPCTDLTGLYPARFRNFGNANALVLSDIILYFLELSLRRLPAKRAYRGSCNIIEEFAAVLAISYIH